jgi:hypothetical protein
MSPRVIRSRPSDTDLRHVAIQGRFFYQGRMSTVLNLFGNLRNGLGYIGELLGYLLRFIGMFFRTRASLA